jgi:hypothetical protein
MMGALFVARTALLMLLSLIAGFAQSGTLDPAFTRIPFDQWLQGGDGAQVRWTVHVLHPQLSNHQRLLARVEVQIDGAELAKRRGKGELVIFVRFKDGEDRPYQDHGTIELEKLEDGIRNQNVTYVESAFVLPGDYRVAVAIFDTATGEHSAKQEKLHVPVLRSDPLPDAWRDLPPVELIPHSEPPDSWYLPTLTGRLHLQAESNRPAQISVLVNLSPSERLSRSQQVPERNLGALLPALKVISQITVPSGSLSVALLDLARRRVTFHQDDLHNMDWPALKDSLTEADSGTIDVKSLEDRHHKAEFFEAEVARRITAAPKEKLSGSQPPARVLIVLSSPVEFESGEDLQPIRLTPDPDCRVFYIRYHPPVVAPVVPVPAAARGRRQRPGYPSRNFREIQTDQLEPTLKPLAPQLFDVETPEQFRKALATILNEISSL